QLLDVRQPGEYEQEHLAGARLIPLKELPERVGELDPAQPVLVYCAIGGRSRAAAQYLNGQGFNEIYNLSGGIKAWQGRKATGPEMQGLDLLSPGTDYPGSLGMGYALEEGLQRFYLRLADLVTEPGQKELLARLAGFEDKHKGWLAEEYEKVRRADGGLPPLASGKGEMIEGGGNVSEFLARVRPDELDLAVIFDLAMGFETQALDLYGRLAVQAARPEVRTLFLRLVDEEKLHLGYLAKELERLLGEEKR
ncbi:MAG TPA: rhodanese-like domain-containing protein, partial [Desulfurivibrionaceae bacterium]|nr:rhodanese-like domain-containing protein [Desulfurivibrionaceae bacterium]